MMGSFTWLKRTNVGQEPKQLQTALIGVLASSPNRAQQAIDRLSQHAAAPRAPQELTEFFPGRPKLGLAQWGRSFIQTLLPQPLVAGSNLDKGRRLWLACSCHSRDKAVMAGWP